MTTLPTPVHYWNFDEASGAGAVDSIGGAKLTIDRPSWVAGKFGSGLRWNPRDGAMKVSSDLPERPAPWTVSLWVLWEEVAENGSALLSGGKSALKLEQWDKNHVLGFTEYSYGQPDVGGDCTFGGPSAPLGEWAHLTFVCTAVDIKLYVNGKLAGVEAESVILGMDWIGSSHGTTEFASMILDELKIFDRALTDAEVAELHEKPPTPQLKKSAYTLATSTAMNWLCTQDGKLYQWGDVADPRNGNWTRQKLSNVAAVCSGFGAFVLANGTTSLLTGATVGAIASVVGITSQMEALTRTKGGEDFPITVHCLREDGTVWSKTFLPGATSTELRQIALSDIVAIDGGREHSAALRADGTVWTWGSGAGGQLGYSSGASNAPSQVPALKDVVSVACSSTFRSTTSNDYPKWTVVAKKDGTVWAFGDAHVVGGGSRLQSTKPVQVEGLANITSVWSGYDVAYAIDDAGGVWSWGNEAARVTPARGEGPYTVGGRPAVTSGPLKPGRIASLPPCSIVKGGFSYLLAIGVDGSVWFCGLFKPAVMAAAVRTATPIRQILP